MARIAATNTIPCAPDVIFDHWTDGRRFPTWKPDTAKHVELLTPEPVGLGSRFHGTYKGIGEVEWEIVDYERPHRVTTLAHTKFGDLRHTIVLESTAGTTQVTQIGETKPTGIMRLLGPIMAANIKKGFYGDAQLLARHLTEAVSAV
jgi:uncharacterized protein YndB with AHSA1/START domain